jgi:hypothetical protein
MKIKEGLPYYTKINYALFQKKLSLEADLPSVIENYVALLLDHT